MKKIIIIIFSFCVLGNTVKSQTVPLTTGSKVSQEDAQAALDFHNKVRKDVGCPPLKWNIELAGYAQEWADYLAAHNGGNIEHRRNMGMEFKKVGENIFGGSGIEYTALDASKSWYSEINNYSYTTLTYRNFYATGHYTQMVWRRTKKVGIGIARCQDGGIIIVANYDPFGNVVGQKPY